MKATEHYAEVKDVDPMVVLNGHTREHIDHWVSKFPPDRKRSAVISALHAVQHENQGYMTTDLMDSVAEYLGLKPSYAATVGSGGATPAKR